MTLDDLVAELRGVFGSTLHAMVLYGLAAADASAADHGAELHTLVVVGDLPLERLEEAGAHVEAWVKAGHPPPLVFTLAEWRSSIDIFPEEYADILEQHRVLYGALPTAGMQVSPAELRLAVEHDAMGKLLQLRRGVLAAGGDATRRLGLLAGSLGAVLEVFRGTLRVHGVRPAADAAAVCSEVGFRAGVDAAPFLRVLAHRRGERPIAPAEVHGVLAGYLAGMEALVAHLDQVRPVGT